jgi:uncharacterized protein
MKHRLKILPGLFVIHQMAADADIPADMLKTSPVWIGRTADELSLVCAENHAISSAQQDTGWRCLEVIGPFDLSTTIGVLSSLTQVLATAEISVFALSTFNTDYLLVKDALLHRAHDALTRAGHDVIAL